jgi:hypothetical protein
MPGRNNGIRHPEADSPTLGQATMNNGWSFTGDWDAFATTAPDVPTGHDRSFPLRISPPWRVEWVMPSISWLSGSLAVLLASPAALADATAGRRTSAGAGWVLLGDGDVSGASLFVEHELPIVGHYVFLVPRAGFLLASRTDNSYGAGEVRVDGVVVGQSEGITLSWRAWSAVLDLDLLLATPRIGNLRLGIAAGPSLRYLAHRRPGGAWSSWSPEERARWGATYRETRGFDPGLSYGLHADLTSAGFLVGARASYSTYPDGTPVLLVGASLGW